MKDFEEVKNFFFELINQIKQLTFSSSSNNLISSKIGHPRICSHSVKKKYLISNKDLFENVYI